MEEAERLADRIAIIAAGEIVAEGTPKTLGGRQLGGAQITFVLPEGVTVEELPPGLVEGVPSSGATVGSSCPASGSPPTSMPCRAGRSSAGSSSMTSR